MRLNTLIVDDEYAGRNSLLTLLRLHCASFLHDIDSVSTLEDAKKHLLSRKYDIIFLDIQLNLKSGFDLIENISEYSKIIFVTAFSKYAISAIKYRAFDYILKPVDPEELKESIRKCNNHFEKFGKQFLTIKLKGLTVPIELSNIVMIKAKGPYAEINDITGKVYVTSQTLKTLNQKLNEHFLRVHKSFIVNRNFINGYNQKELFLDKLCVPLSRNGLTSLQEYFSS